MMATFREVLVAALFITTPVMLVGPAIADDVEVCANESDDVAMAACTRAIATGQFNGLDLARLHYNRAYEYDHTKGQYNKAIEDYSEAIRISPDYANALTNRCSVYAIVGRFQQALADCNESMRLSPNQSGRHMSRGFTYFKMGKYDDAIADYNIVLRLQPNSVGALYSRGMAKLKKGDRSGGNADISAAKKRQANIAEEFEKDKMR